MEWLERWLILAVTVKCWPMITPPSIKFFLSGQASTLVIHAPSPLVLVLVCSLALHPNYWLRIQSFVYLDPPIIITSTSPSSGVTSTNIALISVVVVVVVVAVVLAVMLFIVSFMFYQNKGIYGIQTIIMYEQSAT